MADDYQYLLPDPDPETEPFWEAAKNHELQFQQCTNCQTFRHPPRKPCGNCGSEKFAWVKVSGEGTLYTHIEVIQPVLPQWRESTPYNIVQVSIDDAPGVIIMGNVVEMDGTTLKVGMKVKVTFDNVTDEVTIPRWTPA